MAYATFKAWDSFGSATMCGGPNALQVARAKARGAFRSPGAVYALYDACDGHCIEVCRRNESGRWERLDGIAVVGGSM